ncbi:MAG: GTPase ObgE [Oscillospiraceae bacterium]
MFVDKVKILVRAGKGGDGAIAFHREKYVAAGGPDGGDGGKGGNIVLVPDTNLSTLVDFKYKKKFIAKNGENGGGKNCSGRSGEDLTIKVPVGTVVKDANSGRIMADVSTAESVVIAKGGRGGWGNAHFATPTRQIPRFSKPGLDGEEFDLVLELKLLADVGLVGFPNVGKSTFISVVSEAKPKIANYHFTTLTPVLGVVKIEEGKSFVMADIPGLIEGASDGVGLGHEFLRHVERCRLIVHVVDVSGIEGRDPIEDFEAINKELANFSEELSTRNQIVVANKCDIATPEQIEKFKNYIEAKGYSFFAVSAVTAQGVKPVIYEIQKELEKLPPIKRYEPEPQMIVSQSERDTWEFEAFVEDGVYYLEADWFNRVFGMVDPDDHEALGYMHSILEQHGVLKKLEEMGIQDGDIVSLMDIEFEYVK